MTTDVTPDNVRDDVINHSAVSDVDTSRYPDWLWDRLAWFQDRKFGLMMHWGIYSLWGCIESWPLSEEDVWARPDGLRCWEERGRDLARFRRDYWDLRRRFNPLKLDPRPWAEAAKYAGMTYVNFTTKHHDGFCMWDTATTDLRITHPDCPFHRDPRADVVPLVWDTFRKADFAVSCYFSKSDWHTPYYWDPARPAPDRNPNYDTAAEPERWANFVSLVHSQIQELLSKYGKVDVLWLDGGQVRPPHQDINMDALAAMARDLQPGLIIADRTVGGEHENVITPEQEIPDAPLGHPWESCITLGEGWSYRPDDTFKSAAEVVHMLIEVVSKGGNLLLNVAPSPEGTWPAEVYDRLRDVGDWMQVHAEAIHGTRAIAPYADANIRFTRKGNAVYAFVLPDTAGRLPAEVAWRGLPPPAGSALKLLGRDGAVTWRRDGERTVVELPPGLAGPACCLRFKTS